MTRRKTKQLRKKVQKRKEKLRKTLNPEAFKALPDKLIPQIILQSVILIVVALASFFLMTWLVTDVFEITETYQATAFEALGSFIILVATVSPLNVALYRTRSKEVKTLSKAIQAVANGNYATRIATKKRRPITPVYASFNKMCAELESVQMLRNDFVNHYSHEFKTPIASINGFAALLLEKDLPPQEQRMYLEIIMDESERLSRLAKNTLLLSKLSAQQIVTDVETYDLSEQLRQCSILLSKKWMEKHIQFQSDLPPVSFSGNKDMMQHLWINLLDNATKYTPAGGEIRVRAAETEQSLTVEIADSGEGISEEKQKHLFDPYFQGDSTQTRQGLGLGLSIAQRIVELCGGTIAVQSRPGEGSAFTVTLPKNE